MWKRRIIAFFAIMSMLPLCACGAAIAESAESGITTLETSENQITEIPNSYVKKILSAESHLVIMDDGSLWAWGSDMYGQFGVGGPAPVKIMDSVASVSNGNMIIQEDGSLWGWGNNEYGQLCNGTTEDSQIPVKIMDHVMDVSISGGVVVALQDDGSLWAWGNYYEKSSSSISDRYAPIKILDSVRTIVCGGDSYSRFAAIKEDGSLWVWGLRCPGAFPPGEFYTEPEYEFFPTPAKVMESVAVVEMDSRITVVVKQDGSLWSWDMMDGRGMWKWDGDSGTYSLEEPRYIMDSVVSVEKNDKRMAIKSDGSLWAWNVSALGGQYSPPAKVMDSVVLVSASLGCTVAIKEDGSLWIWGDDNKYGQLGLGKDSDAQLTPVKVMDSVATVEICWLSVYVIKQDGTLWAWGQNNYYQLGDGTNQTRYTPIKIMDNVMIPGSEPSSWANAEVNSLNARGVIPAALKGNYQRPIRRDEFTALMVNVYESAKGPVTTYSSPFTDIADSPYQSAIEKAKTVGLIDGTSEGKFTPSGLLTREQSAKILSAVVSKIEEIDSKPISRPDYSDNATISDWAVDYVAYAQENKIMNGIGSDLFDPQGNLTREMAMLVAERLIVRYGW